MTQFQQQQTLMCNNCYNFIPVNYDISIMDNKNGGILKSPAHFNILGGLHDLPSCPFCRKRNTYFFLVEPNIAEAVSILNKVGYRTYSSCQGHGTYKYIKFQGDEFPSCDRHFRYPFIIGYCGPNNKPLTEELYNTIISSDWYVLKRTEYDIGVIDDDYVFEFRPDIYSFVLESYNLDDLFTISSSIPGMVNSIHMPKSRKEEIENCNKALEEAYRDKCIDLTNALKSLYKNIL